MVYLLIVVSWSALDRILALGGACMIQMERLVLDVVLSVIGDEAERLSLESDFDTVDVDQLTMTQIVLALESRLGVRTAHQPGRGENSCRVGGRGSESTGE